MSVWQHVKLSKQIRPWDTLALCWDIKQPVNKQTTARYYLQGITDRVNSAGAPEGHGLINREMNAN